MKIGTRPDARGCKTTVGARRALITQEVNRRGAVQFNWDSLSHRLGVD
jgi:hypothetical protein